MSVKYRTQRPEGTEPKPLKPSAGAEDIRDRLLRAVKRSSSEETLQRLVELAARCVSEAVAWDAFADAQDVDGGASWTDVQRLGREAHAAKEARIRVVSRLRSEMGE